MKRTRVKWRWIAAVCAAAVLLASGIVTATEIHKTQQQRREQQQLELGMKAYRDAKTQRFAQENAAYDDYEVEVAFLGDSLTDYYDLEKYYPQYITTNRGIGGDTTFDLQARLPVSVYDLKPQVTVMLIGANNADTMLDNYEEILQGLQTHLPQTKIVLLSMTAMGGKHWGPYNPQACYNNVSIRLLAEKYGYTYVDLFTPLYDVATGEVYAGYTEDGGHFTEKGYEVVTALITPVLEELLGK